MSAIPLSRIFTLTVSRRKRRYYKWRGQCLPRSFSVVFDSLRESSDRSEETAHTRSVQCARVRSIESRHTLWREIERESERPLRTQNILKENSHNEMNEQEEKKQDATLLYNCENERTSLRRLCTRFTFGKRILFHLLFKLIQHFFWVIFLRLSLSTFSSIVRCHRRGFFYAVIVI